MGKTIFLTSLFTFCIVRISFASFINIHTTIQSTLEANTVTLNISIENRGDETAHDVQTEFLFESRTFYSPKTKKLKPNLEISYPLSFDIPPEKQGDYPLIIVTHYADANGYPFSALSCILVSSSHDTPPLEIFGSIETQRFSKTGRVKVMLKNKGENDVSPSVHLIVPRELKVSTPPQRVSIAATSQKELLFEIENFSALSGSTYQIYAIAEYDKNEFHKTGIVKGSVFITKSNHILGIDHNVIIGVLILSGLVFLIAQIKKRK